MHLAYLRLTHPEIPLSHWLHLIAQNLHWQVSTPTNAVPLPASDRIRRRISSLSLRLSQTRDDDTLQQRLEQEEEQQHFNRRRSNSTPPPFSSWIEERVGFNLWKLLRLLAVLTFGLTVPALSWYSAVPLTTMADITTIYNTYAVWALVFSIWFLGESWERRKVFSVLLACGGVILVAYGGAEHRRRPREKDPVYGKPGQGDDPVANATMAAAGMAARSALTHLADRKEDDQSGQNPVLGDLLAFIGAVTMAAYEMAFKVVGTLPDEQGQNERYSAVSRDRTARAQSYAGYNRAGLATEEQGLLGEEEEQGGGEDQKKSGEEVEGNCELQHVLGDDDEDDQARARSTERTAIWNDNDISRNGSPSSYQAIGPQAKPGDEDPFDAGDLGRTLTDTVPTKTDSKRKSVKINEGEDAPRVTEEEVAEDASEEESVVEEADIEEIQKGSTRLHRTKSASTVGRSSLRNVFDADEEDEQGDQDQLAGARPRSVRVGSSMSVGSTMHQGWMPPPLPFGLHAIIITSGIGLVTFSTLWIGIVGV